MGAPSAPDPAQMKTNMPQTAPTPMAPQAQQPMQFNRSLPAQQIQQQIKPQNFNQALAQGGMGTQQAYNPQAAMQLLNKPY